MSAWSRSPTPLCLVATGGNRDGCREILGIHPRPGRPRHQWVHLVTSDAHAGLVTAIGGTCPAHHGSDAERPTR